MSTTHDDLPAVDDDLTGLTGQWHRWPVWHRFALVRREGNRWIAVGPTRSCWGVYVGHIRRPGAFHDLWLYATMDDALRAAHHWDGGQLRGWLYHPRTGRHRHRHRQLASVE